MAINRTRKKPNNLDNNPETGEINYGTTEPQLQPLLAAMIAAKNGDFTVRLPVENNGLGEIATVFNEWVNLNQNFANEVNSFANEVGKEGKLGVKIKLKAAAGSWQELLDNLNQMSANLAQQIKSINEVTLAVAQGNLAKQIKARNAGEFQQLSDNANQMINSLKSSIRQMADVAIAVASSAEQLTAVSQEMSANAEQTSEQATSASASAEQVNQNSSTVVTAVEEMNASIREIAKTVANSATVAAKAVKTAESTNQNIAKLGQSSVEIGKVIKVITAIAQQTNLLALNATIEAARAGDAGRGFAVVANEVKELAKQTANATEDISQRIEAIQTDTKGAVTAITQITDIINQINDLQSTIASAVEEQSLTTNEIARNIAEAAQGTSGIAKNIGIVAINAQTTTIGANNTSQAATELARMAVDLQKVVNQFKY
ncbi:methyl-accepting chemotaxis protein [Calothrix sp. FACHB-1219]|uniref:methyl-accepting chemotaxis protein n=1 Tax=unclassified Calothrix TaxID=2619626 RepID=UPI0016877C06|nr:MULTISPECIES: methyl-accepting chemotaxis protein [unclassified Calothrix]MBD2203062.1 methyl-accepting chemotaxis protein [Calothrix sp. FACHB-168]MBD2218663.1 methyl-accepting chemotaxis protein [Calothrix sp. FACHB-1219]